jgi:hypothetical protein
MTLVRQSDTILQNNSGRAYAGVRVRAFIDGVEQQLYSDAEGTPVSLVQTNANGFYQFWIEEGNTTLQFSIGGQVLGDGDYALFNLLRQTGGEPIDLNAPAIGYWTDDPSGANIQRLRDRVFIGSEGAKYTGRRTAPLGSSWMTLRGASYFEKNAQATSLSDVAGGRIGFMGGSHTAPGVSGLVNIGIGSFSLNEGEASTGRAYYAEAFNKGNANATVGVEVQGGDFTAIDHVANAYNVTGGYIGLYTAVEGGYGYVTGDANTPITPPTKPGNAAWDVAGGSQGGTSGNHRWRTGIVFRNGALFRGVDGLTGNAKAVSMAQGHEIVWEAAASLRGAALRSDVNATPGADVGVIFKNNRVDITGSSEFPLTSFTKDTAGTPVSYLNFRNARTNFPSTIAVVSADTNAGMAIEVKGTGVLQFKGRGGAAESLRCVFNADYVNFLIAAGGISGGGVVLSSGGPDTNIDITASPKGAGLFGVGYASVAATTPANFSADRYVAIKAGGTTLYIPASTTPW